MPNAHRSVYVMRIRDWTSSAGRVMALRRPGYLVAVVYMHPGNWATSIAGGSPLGYSWLVVILVPNLLRHTTCTSFVHRQGASQRSDARSKKQEGIPFATINSTPALALALFVNTGIMIVAAARSMRR